MTWGLFVSVMVSAAVFGNRSGFSLVTSRRVLHLRVRVSWSREETCPSNDFLFEES